MTLTPKQKEVYEWLQDEKSRQVFLARKKFAENPNNTDYIVERNIPSENLGLFLGVYDSPKGFDEITNKMKIGKFIVYGAGYMGQRVLEIARIIGAINNCICVWDKNTALHGTFIDNNIEIRSPEINYNEFDYVIVSVSEKFKPNVFSEVMNTLHELKVPKEKILRSYFTLFNQSGQYFDKDIIIPRLSNNEVFVDGGSYDFYTSKCFIELCESHHIAISKIYAFEPDEVLYDTCRKFEEKQELIEVFNYGLWSDNRTMYFSALESTLGNSRIAEDGDISIEVVALDNIIPKNEKATFIKLDVEGAELEALKGAEKLIRSNKPKLAISIYHKLWDFIDIPIYLKSVVPEYKLYLRHYKVNSCDTILYCVI